jgi:hypothetical protein
MEKLHLLTKSGMMPRHADGLCPTEGAWRIGNARSLQTILWGCGWMVGNSEVAGLTEHGSGNFRIARNPGVINFVRTGACAGPVLRQKAAADRPPAVSETLWLCNTTEVYKSQK